MESRFTLPIRLYASDRAALEAHFLALGPEDRRLRFGMALRDDLAREYVARIDFGRDEVFVVTGDEHELFGAVHIAFGERGAELGLSVLGAARGRGIGNALFERAVMRLRNRGARTVLVHCLAENQAMMHLARKHGMRIELSGGEGQACMQIDPPTPASHYAEWMRDGHANALETEKNQARLTRRFFALFAPG